ncbi:MAG TPA: nucleoside triphosphate pyrophosphohydrolase [Candidatus Binataceae bacterium]|nr:nucleoside triphosphate pyrophosphohydrolase [Candidatus Binataceae bacterium]
MNEEKEFARLIAVVRELRAKCAWDREQTLADAPRKLIEEAYESADAIAAGDRAEIAEELGDLIVQACSSAIIAAESAAPDLAGVLSHAADKLIRRHPHIYAGAKAATVAEILEQWDQIKAGEKATKNAPAASALADVGRTLPALMRAEKLGEAARRRGMDWAGAREVLAKVREELDEAEAALARGDDAMLAEELGDLMLAAANAPRFIGASAEETLRRACDKFIARFAALEKLAAARGLDLKASTPEQIESLWQEAKKIPS